MTITWTLALLAALVAGVAIWLSVTRQGRSESRRALWDEQLGGGVILEDATEDQSERTDLRYTIDPAARLVRLDYVAYPSFEGWAATMKAIFADPSYQVGFNFLFNRGAIPDAQSKVYIRHVSNFVLRHEAQLRGSRLALVVPTLASYGMGRMSGELIGEAAVQQAVFSDVAKALAWLNEGRGPH